MDEMRTSQLNLADFRVSPINEKDLVSGRVQLNPTHVEQGLAKLVLTIMELLRQLLERQAILRIEKNTLTDDEIEDLGITFMKLEEKMEDLKEIFGLTTEDLNINLGPLGKLL